MSTNREIPNMLVLLETTTILTGLAMFAAGVLATIAVATLVWRIIRS